MKKIPASERELLDLTTLTEEDKKELEARGTLCWCCDHALHANCQWFQGFHPIPGWIAKKGERKFHYPSYMVYDCPMFVPVPKREKFNPHNSAEWVEQPKKEKQYITFVYNPHNDMYVLRRIYSQDDLRTKTAK
jgi:hypothetical protein